MLIVSLVFLLVINFVHVEGAWGDINTEDDPENNSPTVESTTSPVSGLEREGKAATVYTSNFYLAVGLGTVGVLIVLYFIYLFIRGPKVRWKKSKPVNQ